MKQPGIHLTKGVKDLNNENNETLEKNTQKWKKSL